MEKKKKAFEKGKVFEKAIAHFYCLYASCWR